VGGQAVQADLLMQHWRDDPEVDARFLPVDPEFPFGLRRAERVRFLRTLIREPLYWWNLWRRLKDVDVAHIYSASYSSFLLAPLPAHLAARLRGKKTLINYHSGEARDHLERSSIARRALQSADRLVVPSRYLAEVFAEFGLPTLVVPNLVDLAQFPYRERRPLRPHLVCTRGFHPYYSVDVVIRAFSQVQKLFPDAQLDLVGKGRQERELRELVHELQLTGVNFPGVASRQEIAGFYDRADIFINASWLDNMPLSVLEAFASGTPVITTAAEGIRYLVEHERTGLLSPTGDPEALAANVVRVLRESTLAAQLAENAHDECRRYAWSRVRDQWLEVYRSLGLPLQPRAPVEEVGEAAPPLGRGTIG
jgi:glycosyltransferase involved in cell wall biosynthesis